MQNYSLTTKKSWHETMQELGDCFDRWGIVEWTTNYPRGARLTAQVQSEPDRTVTLTYVKEGKTINLNMSSQSRAVDNLRALYLSINSMRLNELRGIAEVLESAYMQLAGGNNKNPREILGIMHDAPLEVAEASYKARVRSAHPDAGGTQEQMTELNWAIDQIRRGLS